MAVECAVAPYTWGLVKDGKEVRTHAEFASEPNRMYDGNLAFVDLAELDLRLKPHARIFSDLPGFRPIPVQMIGLFTDEYRKRLPTDDEIDRYGTRARQSGLHYDIQDRKL